MVLWKQRGGYKYRIFYRGLISAFIRRTITTFFFFAFGATPRWRFSSGCFELLSGSYSVPLMLMHRRMSHYRRLYLKNLLLHTVKKIITIIMVQSFSTIHLLLVKRGGLVCILITGRKLTISYKKHK